MSWAARFPELFRLRHLHWGGIGDSRLLIEFTVDLPADELISNVKIVDRHQLGLVVIETDQGWRSLP